jgi:hypothetical protein
LRDGHQGITKAQASPPREGSADPRDGGGSIPQAENGPHRVDLVEANEERDAALERAARAIAASKRGLDVSDPIINRVWASYVGQARAAVDAYSRDGGPNPIQQQAAR